MGENICKGRDPQGINLQNIQIVHATLYMHTYKGNNPLNQKMSEDLNRPFSKEVIQMIKTHMKTCSTSLIFREMQIKATICYHLTPDRMTIIKMSTKNTC